MKTKEMKRSQPTESLGVAVFLVEQMCWCYGQGKRYGRLLIGLPLYVYHRFAVRQTGDTATQTKCHSH